MPTVAACQLRVADLDVEENLARVADRLAGLPERVDVALFPEMALTGFVADERVREAALRRDDPVLDRVRDLATAHDTAVLVGFVERARGSDPNCYNAAAYVTPAGETTVYRKRHLWGGERAVLDPGDERVVVETPLGRAGLVTCYDLNFVEESAAFAADRVDALFVIGAWPAAHAANWRLLVRARALDGVRWAVACGRTGRRELPDARVVEYAGQSLVARPDGSVHSALAVDARDLVADLDPGALATHRERVGIFEE